MKRNRAGEDELNPSGNNNRPVFGPAGWQRRGGCGESLSAMDTSGLEAWRFHNLSRGQAHPFPATSHPLGVAKRITSCLDHVKGSRAWKLGPWAGVTLPGAKSWFYLL